MATAIDFQALFAEERARMMAEMEGGSSAASSGTAQQPAPGSGSPRTALHSWESLPDPAVPLSSKPRLDLVEREVCSDALGGVHYVPDFVTPEEAAALLARLEEMPEGCWAQLRRRRLQNHGGTPHSDGMMLEPMPRFVQAVSSPCPSRSPFLPQTAHATSPAPPPFLAASAVRIPAQQPCSSPTIRHRWISIFKMDTRRRHTHTTRRGGANAPHTWNQPETKPRPTLEQPQRVYTLHPQPAPHTQHVNLLENSLTDNPSETELATPHRTRQGMAATVEAGGG